MSQTAQQTDFVMSRDFDVPRALLWECFTDAGRLRQWWGPAGFKVIVSDMDLRVGGTYHYALEMPDGQTMWGLFRYREIDPGKGLVFVSGFSDKDRGLTRHPWSDTWPLSMLTSFEFEDLPGGKTRFTVTWRPLDASEEERNTFDQARSSMVQGWTGTLDKLGSYLADATEGA
jgi:uncharacterized protein YndB with AHSA1/START domain